MQNRYVGDVGDYGKYALLRRWCNPDKRSSIRLSVVWRFFPNEELNNDGRHITYLRDPIFGELDSELHSILNSIVSTGQRNIAAIGKADCLPASTVFVSEPIAIIQTMHASPDERLRY